MTRSLSGARVVDVLRAIYRNDGSDAEWRDECMRAILAMHPGARTCTWFEYDWHFAGGDLVLDRLHSAHVLGEDAARDTWLEARQSLPAALRTTLFGRTGAGTSSQISGLGARTHQSPAFPLLWKSPIVDSFGIVAADPSGKGVCASVGLLEQRSYLRHDLRFLQRLASHLSSAQRLRGGASRSNALDRADAIFTPRGTLLHAEAAAQPHRAALGDARGHRHATLGSTADPATALELWEGLAVGRWSLVDHFDSDGKRFLLAMRNRPHVDPRASLTPRERRVCTLVAMGQRDKEIAYQLGLSISSISACLRAARRKLGVRSRTELATTWRDEE